MAALPKKPLTLKEAKEIADWAVKTKRITFTVMTDKTQCPRCNNWRFNVDKAGVCRPCKAEPTERKVWATAPRLCQLPSCGKEYAPAVAPQKYCSEACRLFSERTSTRTRNTVCYCGTPITSGPVNKKYCSDACAFEVVRKRAYHRDPKC
jgi:predicted nucleic acid-binding Zn ribbon protein